MSFFNKIKEKLFPVKKNAGEDIFNMGDEVVRPFTNFSKAYRIGILTEYIDHESQDEIYNYKNKLEQLGYECDVLMYLPLASRELNILLPYFDQNELDKKTSLPNSPKTDRFRVKKFDLLFNYYFSDNKALLYISQSSMAKCRVGPNIPHVKKVSDILLPYDKQTTIASLIINTNKSLELKPYVRKQV